MNLLSDEILNKYLDGELDKNQSAEVEEILNNLVHLS
jgi:anti-sigma factor RsiW